MPACPRVPRPACKNGSPLGGTAILDAEAIARVLEGFREGRRESTETVARWVGAVLRGGNWRFDDPEGVSQEVLLRLLAIVRSGRVEDPGSFQKFVYVVAKNTCVDFYHRERKISSHEDSEAIPEAMAHGGAGPQQRLEERERLQQMACVLQRLGEACRELWDLVYHRGLSAAEVGDRLGITANNVRVRVHRCLEKARGIARDLQSWSGGVEPRDGVTGSHP